MRTFLGVIMVLIVSGDGETISSILNGSVLLPCSCPERDMNKLFSWQMEIPKTMFVFKYNNGTSTFGDRYKDRGEIFVSEHRNNCSVLLTNVQADDQGEYRCSFFSQGQYRKTFVKLNVSASCNVSPPESQKTDHKMRYRSLAIIPIVSVLGLFLVLWRRWKFSESMPSRRRETGKCYCKTRKTNSNVTI